MSSRYITKAELKEELKAFELQLMPKIESLMLKITKEQRLQFERNIEAIVEPLLEKVQALAEGIMMKAETVERFRKENLKDHDWYEARLSKLESRKFLKNRQVFN